MRKNIQKIVKPIAYITTTTLIAATLFACGSKDDEVSKIKDVVENNSVSEDTKSLEEIFDIFFGDNDDSDDNDSKNDNDTNTEQETETSIVTEVDDNGEEVTKVVSVIQTEDGTKKVVDNNNGSGTNSNTSSTQNPSGGNSNNSGNSGNSGNNTSSGGNGNNGNSGAGGNSGNNSNGTVNNKPVTPSDGNSGNGNNSGNTGNSGNAGTKPTAATEDGGNGNKWTFNFCTGEKRYHEDAEHFKYCTMGDTLEGIYHANVTMVYTKDEGGNEVIDPSLMNVPCAEFYYYEWWVCNDCGAKEKVQSALKEKAATGEHSYVDVMTRPATYDWSAWYEKQCTKCGGTANSDTHVPHLKWYNEYTTDYVGLNGLKTYDDESVYQYDSQLTEGLMRWHYEPENNDNGYFSYRFEYIYKRDSNGNPIYEKTLLGYDHNGNAIWNDRPYWVGHYDSGAAKIYSTLADIEKNNVLYNWKDRDASGKEY